MLQHFMKQQQAVWRFQKEHFKWQQKMFAETFKCKLQGEPRKIPEWVLQEDVVEEEFDQEEESEPKIAKTKKAPKSNKKKGSGGSL